MLNDKKLRGLSAHAEALTFERPDASGAVEFLTLIAQFCAEYEDAKQFEQYMLMR